MTGDDDSAEHFDTSKRILLTMAAKREGDFEQYTGLEAEVAYSLFGRKGGDWYLHEQQEVHCEAFRLADDEAAEVLVLRTNTGGKKGA